jgi:hypothetical protein
MKIKLPKQWKHWFKQTGLRLNGSSSENRHRWGKFYLKGKGRFWRVNCHGEFQSSESYETFDRWANSLHMTRPLPRSLTEFKETVEIMIKGK